MLRRGKSSSAGFSLLELIFSIAVLSVGITAVLQALSFSAKVTGVSCDIVRGVFLAEDKLQELEDKAGLGLLDQMPRAAYNKVGKFEWGYSINSDPTINLIRKVDLEISWKRGKRSEAISLATLFYNEEK